MNRDDRQGDLRSYWTRRRLLKTAGVAVPAAGVASLVGCGDDDDAGSDPTATSQPGNQTPAPTTAETQPGIAAVGPGEFIPLAEDTFFTTQGQKPGGTFRWNTQYAGFTAEPNIAGQGDFTLLRQIYQGLWQLIGTSGAIVLYAAGEMESVDELTWTVRLRDNVNFHPVPPVDGRALTPDDVVYSYERAKADPASSYGRNASFIEKIEATGPDTVTFTASFPFSARFENNPVMMVAPEVVEELGEATNRRAIGTGPYMLEGEYDPTAVTRLTRHPSFMLPNRPLPDSHEFQSITDQAAHLAAFRSGQIDHIGRYLPKPIAESLDGDDVTIITQPFFASHYVAMRPEMPPFDDPRVRKAMSLAIDRIELIDKLEFGEGQVNGPLPWALEQYALPEEEINTFYNVGDPDANVAEARQLLEAADVESFPEFELIAPADLIIEAGAAELVAEMLTDVGFKVRLNLLPLTTVVRDRLLPRDYELMVMQTGETEEPLSYINAGTSAAVPGSRGVPVNQAIDDAALAFLAEFDPAARTELVKDAQRIMMPEYFNSVQLWAGLTYNVQKSYVKDYRPGGIVSNYYQYDTWLDQ